MRHAYLVTAFVCVLVVSILGFRGKLFTAPPLDVFPEWAFPGMKYQPKPRAQGESKFFADGRADRLPPDNTVMRGMLRDNDHLDRGKDAAGAFAKGFPAGMKVDLAFIKRGQERYDIYCAVCHGATGAGDGITVQYGLGAVANANYHTDRLRQMTEGEIFNAITNGSPSKAMLPYADKLTPDERWAVIAYIRALQRAQQGTAADVTDAAARLKLGLR